MFCCHYFCCRCHCTCHTLDVAVDIVVDVADVVVDVDDVVGVDVVEFVDVGDGVSKTVKTGITRAGAKSSL